MLAIVIPSWVAAMYLSGAEMSLGNQLVDSRLSHRDNREFGRNEEPVGEDERQHTTKPPQDARKRLIHRCRLEWERG
jgi:hypothetical protein